MKVECVEIPASHDPDALEVAVRSVRVVDENGRVIVSIRSWLGCIKGNKIDESGGWSAPELTFGGGWAEAYVFNREAWEKVNEAASRAWRAWDEHGGSSQRRRWRRVA